MTIVRAHRVGSNPATALGLRMHAILELLDWLICGIRRLFIDRSDRKIIRRFFDAREQRVTSIEWSPLSTGWMSDWRDRFYVVKYNDANGNSTKVTCRTNSRGIVVVADKEVRGESGG